MRSVVKVEGALAPARPILTWNRVLSLLRLFAGPGSTTASMLSPASTGRVNEKSCPTVSLKSTDCS